jgi:hypothetical protein
VASSRECLGRLWVLAPSIEHPLEHPREHPREYTVIATHELVGEGSGGRFGECHSVNAARKRDSSQGKCTPAGATSGCTQGVRHVE